MIKKQEQKQMIETGGQTSLFACASRIRQKLLSDIVQIKNSHPQNSVAKLKQTQLYDAVLYKDKQVTNTHEGLKSLVIDTLAPDVSTVFSAIEGVRFPELIIAIGRGNDTALVSLTSMVTYINGPFMKGHDLSGIGRFGSLKDTHAFTTDEALTSWSANITKRYNLTSSFQSNLACLVERIQGQNDKVKGVTFICDGVHTNTIVDVIPAKERGLEKQIISTLFNGCQAETALMAHLSNGTVQVALIAPMEKCGQETQIKCLVAFDTRSVKAVKKAS